MFPNKQLTVPMPGIEPESVDMVGGWGWTVGRAGWQWDERGCSPAPRAVLAQFITTTGSLAQRGFFLYLTFFCIGAILRQGAIRINFVAKILVVFCGGFGW